SSDALASSIDLREVAVAAEAILESRGTRGAIFDQCFAAVVPLLDQRVAHREPAALDCRAPVRADAYGRKGCNLVGKLFGLGAHFAIRHEVFAESDPEALFGGDLASGQNDFERAALADDAG